MTKSQKEINALHTEKTILLDSRFHVKSQTSEGSGTFFNCREKKDQTPECQVPLRNGRKIKISEDERKFRECVTCRPTLEE